MLPSPIKTSRSINYQPLTQKSNKIDHGYDTIHANLVALITESRIKHRLFSITRQLKMLTMIRDNIKTRQTIILKYFNHSYAHCENSIII